MQCITIFFCNLSGPDQERRIESLLGSSVNSDIERDYLRSKILEIFEESEQGEKKDSIVSGRLVFFVTIQCLINVTSNKDYPLPNWGSA